MQTHPFSQVDVFTAIPTHGNALAVVHDATGLTDAQMATFARWTNLSETAFLLPPSNPEADYRVRIFTPIAELPFAGHPTLGSCAAWLRAGGKPKIEGSIVEECGAGLVRLRQGPDGRLAFAAPPLAMSPVEPAKLAEAVAAIGLDAACVRASHWLVNGPHWLTLLVDSAETVLALEPDISACAACSDIGVVGPYPEGEFAFELRAFAAADGVPEDPVTGSLNAGVAEWLIGTGVAPRAYLASQGARVGRAGRVHVEAADGAFWIGGDVVTVVAGSVTL